VLDGRPVRGPFRRLRTQVDALLIAILFALPWIEIAGEPLLRLDVPNRRFHIFGLLIFPQELFFLWLVVMGLALALFFFTAIAAGCVRLGVSANRLPISSRHRARIQSWRGTCRPACDRGSPPPTRPASAARS
jgi:hypothetical protein